MKKSRHKIAVISLRARRKLFKFFLYVFLFVALIFCIMKFLVTPILVETGESKVKEISFVAMNNAVAEVMRGTITYEDLVHIVTDSSGKISMIQANSVQINALSQKIIEHTYKTLFERLDEPLAIPFGSFTGIPIFSSLGPDVVVDVLPYGSVDCKFLSKFESSGINQTNHKIYLSITTLVNIVMPMTDLTVENSAEVLVCESLIIGEVPNTYLMAAEKGDMLNLVGS